MATYAIGDIQGCFDTLKMLLDDIRFDPSSDRLWLVGDLVNRGPNSLQVLRWARDLGDRVVAVLGNHDLHLLMCAAGAAQSKKGDTIKKVLNARDRESLIDWLRQRPLIHAEDGFAMVHAGLHPEWTVAQAIALGSEISALLTSSDWKVRIGEIRASPPPAWSPDLQPLDRIRAAASVLLRVRMLTADGRLHEFAGEPGEAPGDCVPWFSAPGARWRDHCVIFGHWSALGLHMADDHICLDTGCVWGRYLTAVRLDDRRIFQVRSAESLR